METQVAYRIGRSKSFLMKFFPFTAPKAAKVLGPPVNKVQSKGREGLCPQQNFEVVQLFVSHTDSAVTDILRAITPSIHAKLIGQDRTSLCKL